MVTDESQQGTCRRSRTLYRWLNSNRYVRCSILGQD